MLTKSKIDWTDYTWNSVYGCSDHPCPYCYARKIARRFAENIAENEIIFKYGKNWKNNPMAKSDYEYLCRNIYQFKPTWIESNYQKSFPKKPAKIFVNSMSDPYYWKQSWYEKIVKRIAENQQHTFMILTKHPNIYHKWIFPHNTWLGITACNNIQIEQAMIQSIQGDYCNNKLFLSIEPIQEKIDDQIVHLKKYFDLIIVGPETGNRKDKYICTHEMLEPFFDLDIPVFMKGACSKITDRPLRQEFPI